MNVKIFFYLMITCKLQALKTTSKNQIFINSIPQAQIRNDSEYELSRSIRKELELISLDALKDVDKLYYGKDRENAGDFLDSTHPASRLSSFNNPTEFSNSKSEDRSAYVSLEIAKKLHQSKNLAFSDLFRSESSAIFLNQTPLKGLCKPSVSPDCPSANKYRTFNGTCNNLLIDSDWGSTNILFQRILHPIYSDHINEFRTSISGKPLPSARLISSVLHSYNPEESNVTMYVPQWGQFLDHDITATKGFSVNGSTPKCCGVENPHPECQPIEVPENDPFFTKAGVNCLNFVRSVPGQEGCKIARREQINTITAFIDGSQIYGNSLEVSNWVRIHRKGLLQFGNGTAERDTCINTGGFKSECIKTGDHARHNEQPGLLAMHTLFVTEHNRIALELGRLNPNWNDETLYQETRRIIVAILQHITYNEFLPVVLGDDIISSYNLELRSHLTVDIYSPVVNPSILNGFATAAFRFGHALVPNMVLRSDRDHKILPGTVPLHRESDEGDIGTSGSLHRILRGLSSQKTLHQDRFMSYEMTRHLFQGRENKYGIDLAAVNIQRGRDHGLPPYILWRKRCELSEIDSWNDLIPIAGSETTEKLKSVYESVEDIDLFSGGLSEKSVKGGLVGPTFACILGMQFRNLRKGDRFWYENSNFESSFTDDQLNAIKDVTLSQIICRALGNGNSVQHQVFIPPNSSGNERVKCVNGNRIDLRPWKE